MKHSVLLLAGALVFMAPAHATELPVKAPAGAVPPTSGFASLWGGASFGSQPGEGSNDTAYLVGADARFNWWSSPTTSIQFDLEGEYAGGYYDCCGNTDFRWNAAAGMHFAVRDPASYALGWFAGVVNANNLDLGNKATYGLIGLEGQRYLGAWTHYGQAGYLHLFHGRQDMENTWFLRGVSRYFSDPNTKLSAELGYARGRLHSNPSNKLDMVTWGLAAEHKLAGSPASAFLAYTGGFVMASENNSDRAVDHTVMVGVRIYANQATLLSNDRTGASFDKPTFLRYLPWVGEAD